MKVDLKNVNPWIASLVTVAVVGGLAGYFFARSCDRKKLDSK